MRVGLRWKILLLTVLPLLFLAFLMFNVVNRDISGQVELSLREDLVRAAAVFDNMLAARAEELSVASLVIVQDPRFFSVLTLPAAEHDVQYRATVAGVARDFNSITRTDIFEVLDRQGQLVASVGRESSTPTGRGAAVVEALSGQITSGILVERQTHYQVTVTPVVVGGRVVGALLVGARIGQELAERLRSLTRSDVTFLSRATVTGSTLEQGEDPAALVTTLDHRPGQSTGSRPNTEVFEVAGVRHRYLTLARPLGGSNPRDGQTYVMQRALDTETAFLRDIQTRLLELSLLAALLVLVAGALISDRITSPVQRLVRGAEEMERGNYDFPLQVRSRDEIGYLATRFEEMRSQQRAYVSSLEEVARLKSEFISVASHELRTPISVIAGFHELMACGKLGAISPPQQKALEAIGRNLETLTRIAEDATRVAQVEGAHITLRRRNHPISSLLEESVKSSLAAAPGRHVNVVVNARDVGTALVDGPRLTQAVSCLVRNGIRFTPDGGRVEVRARLHGNAMVIEVEDSGVGIPPEKIKTLFERGVMISDSMHHHSSSTLEFNSSGLGLGLSITRGIAEAHGGTLKVKSEVNKGSTFSIWLPLEARDKLEAAA
jgi:signal transduction histidine kinase